MKKKSPAKSEAVPQKLPEPVQERTEMEARMLADHKSKVKSRLKAPRFKLSQKDGNDTHLTVESKSASAQQIDTLAALNAFGTTSIDLQNYMMCELLEAVCKTDRSLSVREDNINGLFAAMQGIEPRDEIESMLASQMVATHFAAMRVMRQLKNSDAITQQDSNGNLATKLLRTYTAQMEALQRYRSKGQQKMTVEHVHVYEGGQAIVGNVTQPQGGGAIIKTEDQPHAKEITHAPMPEMPSKNKKRQRVPIPSHA
jgi:hypothetical protein